MTHGWPSARESNSDDLEYVLVCVLELYMIYSLCTYGQILIDRQLDFDFCITFFLNRQTYWKKNSFIFALPQIYLRKSAAHSSKIDHYKTKTTAKKVPMPK